MFEKTKNLCRAGYERGRRLAGYRGPTAFQTRVTAAAAAVFAGSIFASGADAQTAPTYITDIGVVPDDVITGLTGVLTPFLIAAITIGFAFFAVKRGVRWIKGMVG